MHRSDEGNEAAAHCYYSLLKAVRETPRLGAADARSEPGRELFPQLSPGRFDDGARVIHRGQPEVTAQPGDVRLAAGAAAGALLMSVRSSTRHGAYSEPLALASAKRIRRVWTDHPALAAALLAVAAVLLGAWVHRERRSPAPLVDLSRLRNPAVAGANAVMLLGGIGMYLLLTLVTRYVQTPRSTGYGFGVDVFVAGLVLVPFSALGFAGGKLVPPLRKRLAPATVLAVGGAAVLAALVLFALTRDRLWLSFAVMGVLGLGVGVFSAAMPAAILAVTPAEETSSAMSFNQVVRSVGFSIGSALGGLTLAAETPVGATFPTDTGYTTAAWVGAGAMTVTVVTALTLRQASRREPAPCSGLLG
ncbi:MFS transporter [Streptomyces milbemycinicus]|uniref:MFS transporter n=1 Tax=Streptomyces milbemycinicus TaxID=476552 RepID=UPI0021F8A6F9|nr:MFS transporter [Streptomyces milbemycinicus]